ncbi:uncharacterized protein BXZ73DRAFT_80597 [Epithele typhae]|uniref:uncharacterized protein n=1 Tax=Epithele typhae TaxID=378194 RepID=UPI0020076C01|nr:uncharacterized protein BXZ73DRAFT_80597 [Epithele typhae]KAH9918360.1 hypothetical protein BXZ73DRAFT_80597 [Epithele typhae]
MSSVRLMHVCRLWRATALKTPQLWAEAAAAPGTNSHSTRPGSSAVSTPGEDRISFAATAIELSSPAPLRLKIHFLPDALSHTLSPHTSRLVDLFVRLQSAAQFKSLCALLANGVPNLNVLGIAFPGYTGVYREWLAPVTGSNHKDVDEQIDQKELAWGHSKWNLPGVQGLIADTPRLHTLRCVPIDLVVHFACPTVRDMCITPAVNNRDHLEAFVCALRNTPGLTRLDLCMENRSDLRLMPDDGAYKWVAPVNLPALRTLVVNINGNMKTVKYLDLITLSSSVGIHLVEDELSLSHLCRDLPSRHTRLIRARVRSASTVHISDLYDQWNVPNILFQHRGTTRSSSASPSLPTRTACTIWTRWTLSRFPRHRRGHHSPRPPPKLGDPDLWERAVGVLPRVPAPHLARPRRPPRARVIKALQRPDADGSPDALVCPRLKTLKVAFGLNRGDERSASREAWAALRVRPAGWGETVLRAIPPRVAVLVKLLGHRAKRGLRLERLEWEDREWDAALRLEFPPSAVVGRYVPSPELFDQEELEKLVDGPVVFGGFTYRRWLSSVCYA